MKLQVQKVVTFIFVYFVSFSAQFLLFKFFEMYLFYAPSFIKIDEFFFGTSIFDEWIEEKSVAKTNHISQNINRMNLKDA